MKNKQIIAGLLIVAVVGAGAFYYGNQQPADTEGEISFTTQSVIAGVDGVEGDENEEFSRRMCNRIADGWKDECTKNGGSSSDCEASASDVYRRCRNASINNPGGVFNVAQEYKDDNLVGDVVGDDGTADLSDKFCSKVAKDYRDECHDKQWSGDCNARSNKLYSACMAVMKNGGSWAEELTDFELTK